MVLFNIIMVYIIFVKQITGFSQLFRKIRRFAEKGSAEKVKISEFHDDFSTLWKGFCDS